MSIDIDVNGSALSVPSSAADTNWAAAQIAFEQAVATYLNATGTAQAADAAAITVLQGDRVKVLSKNVTPVGTGADTTEDNLMTYTLTGGVLSANGEAIRVTGGGEGLSTADATALRCYFGSTLVGEMILATSQYNSWRVQFEVFRTGAATQIATCSILTGGVSASPTVTLLSAPSETLSGNVVVKFTGQRAVSSVADSVRQYSMVVELIP